MAFKLTDEKKLNMAKKILDFFGSKENLQEYWRTHSRGDIGSFSKNEFGISYYILRPIVIDILHIQDRTREESIKINQEKARKTCLEKYGVERPFLYGSQEFSQLMFEKYGVDNYFKLDKIKEETSKRCKGISLKDETKKKLSDSVKSKECQEKTIATNRQRYNKDYTFQVTEFKEKAKITRINKYGCYQDIKKLKQTFKERYGVEHPPKRVYIVNDDFFDSLPEVAFYLYAIEHNEQIKRLPCKLEYIVDNKVCYYFPDFEYKGELIELKGKQFLKEDGSWQNPFDHSLDYKSELKHQCALKNNVKILYNDDYKMYLDWYYSQGYTKKTFLNEKK